MMADIYWNNLSYFGLFFSRLSFCQSTCRISYPAGPLFSIKVLCRFRGRAMVIFCNILSHGNFRYYFRCNATSSKRYYSPNMQKKAIPVSYSSHTVNLRNNWYFFRCNTTHLRPYIIRY